MYRVQKDGQTERYWKIDRWITCVCVCVFQKRWQELSREDQVCVSESPSPPKCPSDRYNGSLKPRPDVDTGETEGAKKNTKDEREADGDTCPAKWVISLIYPRERVILILSNLQCEVLHSFSLPLFQRTQETERREDLHFYTEDSSEAAEAQDKRWREEEEKVKLTSHTA